MSRPLKVFPMFALAAILSSSASASGPNDPMDLIRMSRIRVMGCLQHQPDLKGDLHTMSPTVRENAKAAVKLLSFMDSKGSEDSIDEDEIHSTLQASAKIDQIISDQRTLDDMNACSVLSMRLLDINQYLFGADRNLKYLQLLHADIQVCLRDVAAMAEAGDSQADGKYLLDGCTAAQKAANDQLEIDDKALDAEIRHLKRQHAAKKTN